MKTSNLMIVRVTDDVPDADQSTKVRPAGRELFKARQRNGSSNTNEPSVHLRGRALFMAREQGGVDGGKDGAR
jgi:hypothetical protein